MRRLLWCSLCFFLCGATTATADLLSLEYEGLDRRVWLENTGEAPRPLIVYLHSWRDEERQRKLVESNYQNLAWESLDEQARQHGFAVAYPSSLAGEWAVSTSYDRAKHPETGELVDDLGFVESVIDDLVANGIALEDEVYLVGNSNGALLSFQFMCRPDHPFAGVITMIASIQDHAAKDCDPKIVPYTALAGTHDRILAYDGWVYPGGRTLSVPETMHIFVQAHGCQRQNWHELPDIVPEDNSKIRLIWWSSCDTPDGSVRLLRMEGAGHIIPQPKLRNADWVKRAGGQNQDLEASEYILDFFTGNADLPVAD